MLDTLVGLLSADSEADRQVAALKALPDAELADLGIARDQIEGFVLARLPVE